MSASSRERSYGIVRGQQHAHRIDLQEPDLSNDASQMRRGRHAGGSRTVEALRGERDASRLAYVIGDGRPVTITLTEAGANKTNLEVILTLESQNSEEQQREGWTAMFVNLGKYLAKAA